jgi:hypothetical protein
MTVRRTHLDRLERAFRESQAQREHQDDDLVQLLCSSLLAVQPDLRLIELCDTDPETFAGVQRTIAYAGGDFQQAARLEAVLPCTEGLPSRDDTSTLEAASHRVDLILDQGTDPQSLARDRAIASARRRLGLPRQVRL